MYYALLYMLYKSICIYVHCLETYTDIQFFSPLTMGLRPDTVTQKYSESKMHFIHLIY